MSQYTHPSLNIRLQSNAMTHRRLQTNRMCHPAGRAMRKLHLLQPNTQNNLTSRHLAQTRRAYRYESLTSSRRQRLPQRKCQTRRYPPDAPRVARRQCLNSTLHPKATHPRHLRLPMDQQQMGVPMQRTILVLKIPRPKLQLPYQTKSRRKNPLQQHELIMIHCKHQPNRRGKTRLLGPHRQPRRLPSMMLVKESLLQQSSQNRRYA